jgi:predicted AAA+ superfamily ATPase
LNFERAVISLFENYNYKFDIYLTGSNSKMFSEELSTLFTGRNIEIKCHPFCFSEYLEFIKKSKLIKETNKFEYFENYFIYGGLPIIFEVFDDKSLIQERLTQVLSDTIKKDIKRRHNIRKIDELYRLCQFTINNIGHTFSTRNIANYLKSNEKSKISHMTIESYLL